MKKTKQFFFYKEFFENQWCPLFGALPEIPQELQYYDSNAMRCLNLIHEAREIWGIFQFKDWPWTDSICPDEKIIEEKFGYNRESIVSVRMVFQRGVDISFNYKTHYIDLESDIDLTAGAEADTFMRNRKRYEKDIKTNKFFKYEYEEFMPHLALSLLTIKHAWLCLMEILYYGHEDDSRDALIWACEAEFLMKSAREAINQIEGIENVELEMFYYNSENLNKKIHDGLEKYSRIIKMRNDLLIEMANEIREDAKLENKKLAKYKDLAQSIYDRIAKPSFKKIVRERYPKEDAREILKRLQREHLAISTIAHIIK